MKLRSICSMAILIAANLAHAQSPNFHFDHPAKKKTVSIKLESDNLKHPAVLLPGSTIVAGLEKDEFFILAKDEASPKKVPPIMITVNHKTVQKDGILKLKVALKRIKSQPRPVGTHSASWVAFNKKPARLRPVGTLSAVAVNQKFLEKTRRPRVKMVVHRNLHKNKINAKSAKHQVLHSSHSHKMISSRALGLNKMILSKQKKIKLAKNQRGARLRKDHTYRKFTTKISQFTRPKQTHTHLALKGKKPKLITSKPTRDQLS